MVADHILMEQPKIGEGGPYINNTGGGYSVGWCQITGGNSSRGLSVRLLGVSSSKEKGNLIDYVTSTSSSAYPSDGISSDYWYTKR